MRVSGNVLVTENTSSFAGYITTTGEWVRKWGGLFDGTQIDKMRQQEHQQLNEMDNNDRKRDETTSLDASKVQHKAPVKGRINNDPLTLPHNDLNLKVQHHHISFPRYLVRKSFLVFYFDHFLHLLVGFGVVPVSNTHPLSIRCYVSKVMTLQTV